MRAFYLVAGYLVDFYVLLYVEAFGVTCIWRIDNGGGVHETNFVVSEDKELDLWVRRLSIFINRDATFPFNLRRQSSFTRDYNVMFDLPNQIESTHIYMLISSRRTFTISRQACPNPPIHLFNPRGKK
jgi:hypothetical protein